MKKNLLILGAGGHGKVVADIALRMNRWQHIGFIDDNECIETDMTLEVIGRPSDVLTYMDKADFVVAIGNNTIRENIQEKLESIGASIATLIHPSAIIGKDVSIGKGTVVMAGAVINCSTKIGKGCIINTSCSLDHDNLIEDYVHISPGSNLAGTVKVGRSSWIGIGSVISNNITICNSCIVGAGSVVIRCINESGTYVGVPVKKIK